jgi:hypothetical protein
MDTWLVCIRRCRTVPLWTPVEEGFRTVNMSSSKQSAEIRYILHWSRTTCVPCHFTYPTGASYYVLHNKFTLRTGIFCRMPITVATRSKTWTTFARSNIGIVGSKPTPGMDVCVSLFCVCVVLCVGSGLVTDWSPVQEILPTVYRLRNSKINKGCRAIDRYSITPHRQKRSSLVVTLPPL